MTSLTYAQCIRAIASIVQARIHLLNDSDGIDAEDPSIQELIEFQVNVVCADMAKQLSLGEEGAQIDLESMQFRTDAEREVHARWGIVR